MARSLGRLSNASLKLVRWGCRTDKPAVRNMCANAWGGGLATVTLRLSIRADQDSPRARESPKSGLRAATQMHAAEE